MSGYGRDHILRLSGSIGFASELIKIILNRETKCKRVGAMFHRPWATTGRPYDNIKYII